jgi:hypothetical protein
MTKLSSKQTCAIALPASSKIDYDEYRISVSHWCLQYSWILKIWKPHKKRRIDR